MVIDHVSTQLFLTHIGLNYLFKVSKVTLEQCPIRRLNSGVIADMCYFTEFFSDMFMQQQDHSYLIVWSHFNVLKLILTPKI